MVDCIPPPPPPPPKKKEYGRLNCTEQKLINLKADYASRDDNLIVLQNVFLYKFGSIT